MVIKLRYVHISRLLLSKVFYCYNYFWLVIFKYYPCHHFSYSFVCVFNWLVFIMLHKVQLKKKIIYFNNR